MSSGTLLGLYVRYVGTVCLLVIAWFHAHWSVALVLTLLSVASEIEARISQQLIGAVREHLEVLKMMGYQKK